MAFSRKQPYNHLPLLPPEETAFETMAVYKKLAEARAALAELKGRLPVIPNPMMLVNTLVLQEARDSSEIENIFTSSDRLFRAFISNRPSVDPATKEVLRYRQALWQGFQVLQKHRKWELSWIVDIFKTITQKDEAVRTSNVYIGNAYNVIYTPPDPGKILIETLENWLAFAEQFNGIDPLIRMAILHYQFESIHPFSDGNGRTGRILNVLYLTHNGLLDLPILYISKYILEFKNEYYRLFTEVTENGNWEAWVLFILEAIYETSKFTLGKVNAIYELFNDVLESVRSKAAEIYSHELIEVLFTQPYCKIQILVDQGIGSRNTASKYLKLLTQMGVLEVKREGKETLYLNQRLYEVLAQA